MSDEWQKAFDELDADFNIDQLLNPTTSQRAPSPQRDTSPLRTPAAQQSSSPTSHGSPQRFPSTPPKEGRPPSGNIASHVPPGRIYHNIPGFGDCLFFSVIAQLETPMTAEKLRTDGCNMLAEMQEELPDFMNRDDDFEIELQELRKPGKYNLDLFDHMPEALSRVLKRKIIIICSDGRKIALGGDQRTTVGDNDICLMKLATDHYNAALVKNKPYPNLEAVHQEASLREPFLQQSHNEQEQARITESGQTSAQSTAPYTATTPTTTAAPVSQSDFWELQLNRKAEGQPITDPQRLKERYDEIMAEIRQQGESAIDQLARKGLDVDFVHPDENSFFAAVGKQLYKFNINNLTADQIRGQVQLWSNESTIQFQQLPGFADLKTRVPNAGQWSNDWETALIKIFTYQGYPLLVFSDFKPILRYDNAVHVNPQTQIIIYRTRHYAYHSTRILSHPEANRLQQQLDPCATSQSGGYGSIEEQIALYNRIIIPEPCNLMQSICRQVTEMDETRLTRDIIINSRKSSQAFEQHVPRGQKLADIMNAVNTGQGWDMRWEKLIMAILQTMYSGQIDLLRECTEPIKSCQGIGCPIVIARKAQYYYATQPVEGADQRKHKLVPSAGSTGGGQEQVAPSSSEVVARPSTHKRTHTGSPEGSSSFKTFKIIHDPNLEERRRIYEIKKLEKINASKRQQQPVNILPRPTQQFQQRPQVPVYSQQQFQQPSQMPQQTSIQYQLPIAEPMFTVYEIINGQRRQILLNTQQYQTYQSLSQAQRSNYAWQVYNNQIQAGQFYIQDQPQGAAGPSPPFGGSGY